MFVLGATLDPATPWANAERIAAAAGDNAYVIVKPGGPHVIFGRGEACPDDLVTAFLDRRHPAGHRGARCAPVTSPTTTCACRRWCPRSTPSTRAALQSADDEIVNSVDYGYWDGEKPLTTGCRFGGTITLHPVGRRAPTSTLEGCSWSAGLGLTGTGVIDDDEGTLALRVAPVRCGRATGSAIERDAKGDITVAR